MMQFKFPRVWSGGDYGWQPLAPCRDGRKDGAHSRRGSSRHRNLDPHYSASTTDRTLVAWIFAAWSASLRNDRPASIEPDLAEAGNPAPTSWSGPSNCARVVQFPPQLW